MRPRFALTKGLALCSSAATEFQLTLQTLCLTVGLLDRYLSVVAVARSKLQLLGVTCMLIASYAISLSSPSVSLFYLPLNFFKCSIDVYASPICAGNTRRSTLPL